MTFPFGGQVNRPSSSGGAVNRSGGRAGCRTATRASTHQCSTAIPCAASSLSSWSRPNFAENPTLIDFAAPDLEFEVEGRQPHPLVAERVEVPLDHPGPFDEVRTRSVPLDREVGAEPAVHMGQVVEPELGEGAVSGRVVVAGFEDLGRLEQVGGEQEPVAAGRGSRRCRPAARSAPPVSRCRCCCPGRPRPDARRAGRRAAGPAPARSGPTARPPPARACRRSACARSVPASPG